MIACARSRPVSAPRASSAATSARSSKSIPVSPFSAAAMCPGHAARARRPPAGAAHGRDRGPGVTGTGTCDQRPGQPLGWDAPQVQVNERRDDDQGDAGQRQDVDGPPGGRGPEAGRAPGQQREDPACPTLPGAGAWRVRHTARTAALHAHFFFCPMGSGVQYPLPPPPLLADGEVPDWGWLLVTGLPDVLRTYQVPPKLVMPSPFTVPGPESPEKVYSGQPL